jgi:signal transduction histidine kinase
MRRIFFSFFLFVITILLFINFVFSPVADMMIERHLAQQLEAYWQELIRGTFHMVFVDLERVPQTQWDRHVDALQDQFGYPIDLKPPTETDLSVEEQSRVMEGRLVVKGDGEIFFMRAGQSPYLLVMGPITDPEFDLVNIRILFWAALLLLMAIMTLIWALPFWRKLQRISTAAAAFGEGQFATRAQVPRRSALAPLADAFNRMADRIQELIHTQRELTNAVSHELRTPIARIRFSLEMLSSATRIGDRRRYAAEIAKDVEELDALVTESLTYARFDRGAPEIDWQPRPLSSWLHQVARTVLQGYREVELRITSHLPDPDQTVYLEPRFMGRALGNLLQNAAKYTDHRVEILLEAAEEAGRCCIHVDDDGEGIPPADRERVFHPFTRLDSSRSRSSGGHGLGLAIVRRVMDWHGGSVEVSDAPLGGARLTLCWPGFSVPVSDEVDG